jgi:hypothetical protein
VRPIEGHGLVAVDRVSGVEVEFTKNSVVFDSDLRWLTSRQRGRVRLPDNEDRVIAEARRRRDRSALGAKEAVLDLKRTEVSDSTKEGQIVGRSRKVWIDGNLEQPSGSTLAAFKFKHNTKHQRSPSIGSRISSFDGIATASRLAELPIFILSLRLAAGGWTSRAPQTGTKPLRGHGGGGNMGA